MLRVYETVTSDLYSYHDRNRSVSQRIRRNVSEGFDIVKVAHNTEPTCRLVVIIKVRFRINVVLYIEEKNK